jgi:HAD superfamily hydrolase (TIGR01662 family)
MYPDYRSGIIFDLDMTLVDTSAIFKLRENRLWSDVYKNIHKTNIYDGILGLLQELKSKYKLGIVTSSPRTYAERLISFHGIEIPILTAYHDTSLHKPDPAPIIHGCQRIGLKPNKVISIGDDLKDIAASNNAGTTSVFVSWGSASTSIYGSNYICRTVSELKSLLEKN